MTEEHESYIVRYWEADQCGNSDEIYAAVIALKKYEEVAFKNGKIKEEDVVIKSVLAS